MMTGGASSSDLPYRLAWRSRSLRTGAHRSTRAGSGGVYRDLASLFAYPDPRRIDMRQSLRDPFEQLYVRRFEERSAIGVTVLLDVSASMSFSGATRKMALAVDLVGAISASARRTGDTFALMGCDAEVRPELVFPPFRARARQIAMIERLDTFEPRRSGSQGLIAAAERLPPRRNLVFVISDFFMAEAQLSALFEALSMHDVLPIMMSDSSEMAALPEWGLLALADLETGRRRLVAMRPSLKADWVRKSEARRIALRRISARHGRDPVELTDRVDWDRLGAALLAGV